MHFKTILLCAVCCACFCYHTSNGRVLCSMAEYNFSPILIHPPCVHTCFSESDIGLMQKVNFPYGMPNSLFSLLLLFLVIMHPKIIEIRCVYLFVCVCVSVCFSLLVLSLYRSLVHSYKSQTVDSLCNAWNCDFKSFVIVYKLRLLLF